jgi:hypothetical protein
MNMQRNERFTFHDIFPTFEKKRDRNWQLDNDAL